MEKVEVDLLSASIAFLALMVAASAHFRYRALLPMAAASKLWDRVYELDKLVLNHPDVFARYMAEVDRKTPFFYAPGVNRDANFYALKAFVYFHLNVFEEVLQTTAGSNLVGKQFEKNGWDVYILRKMRHPLMREVFDRESDTIYLGAFRDFVEAHRREIELPPEPHIF